MLFRVVVCSFENEATTWFKSLPLDDTLLQTFHGHVHALASITNLIGSLLVSMVTRCRRKPDKCPSAETKKKKKRSINHSIQLKETSADFVIRRAHLFSCHQTHLLDFTGFHRVSLDLTAFYWVTMGFTHFNKTWHDST